MVVFELVVSCKPLMNLTSAHARLPNDTSQPYFVFNSSMVLRYKLMRVEQDCTSGQNLPSLYPRACQRTNLLAPSRPF